MLPDVGVASLKQLGVNPSARSKHGGARTGRGRDSAVTRPGVAGPALPRRPDPRVEIEQEGRSRAGREGLGWRTQAAESGVRAGRDGEEQKDEERGGPAPSLESGEGERAGGEVVVVVPPRVWREERSQEIKRKRSDADLGKNDKTFLVLAGPWRPGLQPPFSSRHAASPGSLASQQGLLLEITLDNVTWWRRTVRRCLEVRL